MSNVNSKMAEEEFLHGTVSRTIKIGEDEFVETFLVDGTTGKIERRTLRFHSVYLHVPTVTSSNIKQLKMLVELFERPCRGVATFDKDIDEDTIRAWMKEHPTFTPLTSTTPKGNWGSL